MATFLSAKFCSIRSWTPILNKVRNALYDPAIHKDPIVDKTVLANLDAEGRLEGLKVVPIKPAPNNLSISVFYDPLLKKFTNMVMLLSQKDVARTLLDETFANMKRIQLAKYHAASDEDKPTILINPREIFYLAVYNCKPVLYLIPVKKGGITYQVPVPLNPNKSEFMAMKWIIMAARDKDGPISFVTQLSKELIDAANNEGRVVKRKQDLHKICENNKAYAHYRWS